MRYEVVWNANVNQLAQIVNKEIIDGWEPIGGICVVAGSGYYQAMIRKPQPCSKGHEKREEAEIER